MGAAQEPENRGSRPLPCSRDSEALLALPAKCCPWTPLPTGAFRSPWAPPPGVGAAQVTLP